MEDRGDVGWSQFRSSQETCFVPGGPPRLTPRAEGLVHTPVPFVHTDITPFSSHCLFTAVKVQVVLPTVPGLVLVGKATVKRGRLVILDLGLDVF